MERIIRAVQEILAIYFRITTMVIFASAVYIAVFWGADTGLDVGILWQILGTSAICAIGCFFISDFRASKKVSSGLEIKIRGLLSFIFVNAVILASGFVFEWFYLSDWKMIVGMIVCIALVYTVVTALSYFASYKTAEQINGKLRERENGADRGDVE